MNTISNEQYKLQHSIFILLEGRSYSHLFGDDVSFTKLEITDENYDYWPQENITTNNEKYKKCHTSNTLPTLTYLYETFASIPQLYYENETDGFFENLQHLFGKNGELLVSIPSKIYCYVPSYTNLLNQNIQKVHFDQFFNDVQNNNLTNISVIEANTSADGTGWSMATGGNSLHYAESQILKIFQSVKDSVYYEKSNIFVLWLDNGNLPDKSSRKRIANIWISPYFHNKKIYNYENEKFTISSINNLLKELYLNEKNILHTEKVKCGNLLHENLLSQKPYPKSFIRQLYFSKPSYNMDISQYNIGDEKRIEGLSEKLFLQKETRLQLQNYEIPEVQNDVKLMSSESTKNAQTGFWLIFTCCVLWFILCFGLFYIYVRKYYYGN